MSEDHTTPNPMIVKFLTDLPKKTIGDIYGGLKAEPMTGGQLTVEEFDARDGCRKKSVVLNDADFNVGFAAACWFYRRKIHDAQKESDHDLNQSA